jgi:DNA replication and repair protein RecF
MDSVLSQVDREYRRASLSYEKGLRQRNRLLLRIREEGISRSHLYFWDKLLIKNGEYITQKREELADFINEVETLNQTGGEYEISYDKSIISESRLSQYKTEEIAAATTLVGPHRDDMMFKVKGQEGERIKERDLARYGSRGEQRMGVLWLKMAELAFIEAETQDKPTLLLDDIFSELDHEHRKVVVGIIKNQQTVITSADPHHLELKDGFEKIEL